MRRVGEIQYVQQAVDKDWDGRYLTRFHHEDYQGRWYRTTLHGVEGPVVWTLVRAVDGVAVDMTRQWS